MTEQQVFVFVIVYYRDMPMVLKSAITKDGKMKYSKDGVCNGVGHNCPRMTITMESIDKEKDHDRLKLLTQLLGELESNNQIVSFSVKR